MAGVLPSVTGESSQTTVILCRGAVEVASWPLDTGGCIDLATVDELARLQLVARRLGFTVRLGHTGTELRVLLDLAGLTEVVTVTEPDRRRDPESWLTSATE